MYVTRRNTGVWGPALFSSFLITPVHKRKFTHLLAGYRLEKLAVTEYVTVAKAHVDREILCDFIAFQRHTDIHIRA